MTITVNTISFESGAGDTRGLRNALGRGRIAYSVIHGTGPARLAAALASVRSALAPGSAPQEKAQPRWHGYCDRCGDSACERHLLAADRSPRTPPGGMLS